MIETRYAKVADGSSIAYQVLGDGPRDLVIVPGFVSHLEVAWEHPPYERFMRGLTRFARVIVFDKRSSGLSDPLAGQPSLEQRVDDIGAVLDAVDGDGATLFGISEGAAMAALFAALHPERVGTIVLYGAFARGEPDNEYPWGMDPDMWADALDGIEKGWGEGVSLIPLAPSKLQDDAFRGWFARFERMAASPRVVREALELDAQIDIREVLPSVQAPTLLIHRDGDFWPVEGARYIGRRIPDARLVVLPGENHWPWIDDTDAVAAEIEEFLTGVRPAPESDRILATVLFTDIVASTERVVEQGDRRWRTTLDDHESLLRRELKRFSGREVKTTGDGVLAIFDGPTRAVRCAQAIRDAVRSQGIEIRAGLHTGECELRNGDVGGLGVHIGARVMSMAGGGEVVVSRTVKDLVAGSGIEFEDRGEHQLKGVPGEWRLYAAR